MNKAQIDSVIAGQKNTFDNGRAISEKQIIAMKKGNKPHEFSKSEAFVSRILNLWLPARFRGYYIMRGYSYQEYSFRHNIAMMLSYGLLLPFTLIGFYLLFKQSWRLFTIFLGFPIWHTLIHAIFIPYTKERYRIPISPIIIIMGTAGIYHLFNSIKGYYRNRYQPGKYSWELLLNIVKSETFSIL